MYELSSASEADSNTLAADEYLRVGAPFLKWHSKCVHIWPGTHMIFIYVLSIYINNTVLLQQIYPFLTPKWHSNLGHAAGDLDRLCLYQCSACSAVSELMEDMFIFFQEQTTLKILMKSAPSKINKHLNNLLSRYHIAFFLRCFCSTSFCWMLTAPNKTPRSFSY